MNKYIFKHEYAPIPNKIAFAVCTEYYRVIDRLECRKYCNKSYCSFSMSLREYESMISNPIKWSSTHLQSSNSELVFVAKLLLDDRIIL